MPFINSVNLSKSRSDHRKSRFFIDFKGRWTSRSRSGSNNLEISGVYFRDISKKKLYILFHNHIVFTFSTSPPNFLLKFTKGPLSWRATLKMQSLPAQELPFFFSIIIPSFPLHWNSRSELKWKSLSCVLLFPTPSTIQSMEFSSPECWSG